MATFNGTMLRIGKIGNTYFAGGIGSGVTLWLKRVNFQDYASLDGAAYVQVTITKALAVWSLIDT